jgi:hypothetical protein
MHAMTGFATVLYHVCAHNARDRATLKIKEAHAKQLCVASDL